MKVISIFLATVLFVSQVSFAEPARKPRDPANEKDKTENSTGGSGTAIAATILVVSLIGLAVNSGSEPEGQDHKNNGLFAGLAIASGIGLYVSSKKEKEVRLTLSEEDTPLLAFKYNF